MSLQRGTETSLVGTWPLAQGRKEQERVQQPETGSAAGRKSSWSSSAGQGRAHITVPRARSDAQGRWQSPTRSGQGTAKLQQSQALGRWLWRRQNQTLGAGLGEAPAPGRTWEGEGCQLPSRVPWAPILGLPAARTGSLVPWGAPLHPRCSPDPRVFPCIPDCALHLRLFPPPGVVPSTPLFPW